MEEQTTIQNPEEGQQLDRLLRPINLAAEPEEKPAESETASAAPADTRPPLARALVGATLLAGSITAGVVLIASYVPALSEQGPATQVAAAEIAARENLFKALPLEAKAVYVYDIGRTEEIFASNGNAQLPLASITKIALVLAVGEVLPLDSTITISREAVEKSGGGLTWGEEWNARDLIDFTLITSSNTGAEALREAADSLLKAKYPDAQGSATIWRMNAIARELGMEETYFINPTGLDESTTQAGAVSSARDIAKLFAHAVKTNPALFAGTSKTDIPLGPSNAPERYAVNTNNALTDIEGIVMGKTGTTDLAGGNLAVVFESEAGHPIVVVVLGSTPEGRYDDMRALVEAAQKASK